MLKTCVSVCYSWRGALAILLQIYFATAKRGSIFCTQIYLEVGLVIQAHLSFDSFDSSENVRSKRHSAASVAPANFTEQIWTKLFFHSFVYSSFALPVSTWPEKRLHCNLAFLKATWTQKKTPVNFLVQTSVLTSSFSQGNLLAVLLQSALMALFHKLKAKIDRSHQYFFSGSRKIFAERFSVNGLERPETTFRCLAAASWFVTIKTSLCWIGALGLL